MIEAPPAGPDAPEIVFLGEGPGSARYLEGVLQTAYRVSRVYSSQALADAPAVAERLAEYRVAILSDYPARNLTDAHQQLSIDAVEREGRGLLMIGGWASFSGPRGSYHGSRLAEILPVELSPDDDRTNTPLGTVLIPARRDHPAIATIQAERPCCVVGYNAVGARDGAEVLIEGYQLEVETAPPRAGRAPTAIATAEGLRYTRDTIPGPPRARLEPRPAPMLSVWQRGRGRVAAFAPDVSPHWAGGIIDWGDQRVHLPTGSEIGHLYRAFVLDLCRWLAGE